MKTLLSLFVIFLFTSQTIFADSTYIRYQEPELLSYEELVSLSKNPYPSTNLQTKIDKLFTTPIISNEAYYSGVKPRNLRKAKLGPFIRLVSWNIEKSIGLEQAIVAFTDEVKFQGLIDPYQYPPGSKQFREIMDQRDWLEKADIIVLQEMDIGVKRSQYKNSVKELADALGMNYVYGVEQLEIDPVNLGLKEAFMYEDGSLNEELYKTFKVNSEQYKGLFGSAVLSRYPIKNVELFQLKYQAYDWYHEEKSRIPFLEKVKRSAAKNVFLEKLFREMKIGGRVFLRVDLHVPELPNETLTVINVHLEVKCTAKKREVQMKEILNYIYDVKNPVVLAGDFNSVGGDMSPTSVKREIRRMGTDPTFLFSQAVAYLTPEGMALNIGRAFSNLTKNFQNPTSFHIPIIAPNRVKGLFKAIEQFKFYDGKRFDFRGDKKRSINQKARKLSNSNERDSVGFKMTFEWDRTFFNAIGKYRLDWIFVKPVQLFDPKDVYGSYRFAPHYAITLEEMNTRLSPKISDHSPIAVDLPLEEPRII